MNRAESPRPDLQRVQRGALVAGVAGLALCLAGAFLSTATFFQAYLFAYVFWIGVALGCIAIVMLHYLVGGPWGLVIRRLLEAGAMMVPLMALLFVPLLFGLHYLYAWTHPDVVAADAVLQHKSPYLNVPFFVVRAAVYFAVWIGLAYLLNRWSIEQDRTADPALALRLRRLSAGGLVLYAITVTFAAIDWLMSLEPDWYSTIFGFIVIVSQGLVTFAFAIAVVVLLSNRPPLSAVVTPGRLNDLGNLLLTAVMLWAYMMFAQFLVIWAGNLPEENPWYVHRTTGGWRWITTFLIVFHFALPFFVLLFYGVKTRPRVLATIAAGIFCVHLVDAYWLVVPAFHQTGISIHWLDVAAPVGIGGIWIAAFAWRLGGRPLLPLHDPRLETLHHEE